MKIMQSNAQMFSGIGNGSSNLSRTINKKGEKVLNSPQEKVYSEIQQNFARNMIKGNFIVTTNEPWVFDKGSEVQVTRTQKPPDGISDLSEQIGNSTFLITGNKNGSKVEETFDKSLNLEQFMQVMRVTY